MGRRECECGGEWGGEESVSVEMYFGELLWVGEVRG